MSDQSEQILQLLTEVRDLLRLVAEPAIAQRDKKLRTTLRSIAGNATGKKAKAILLMDGSRTQATITNECAINKGDLSVLVKKLKAAELLKGNDKHPELAISIPSNFFEHGNESDE